MKKILLLLAVLALTGPFCGGCRRQNGEEPGAGPSDADADAQAVPVRLEAVERLETSFPVHAAAVLARKETVRLSFKTGGLIAAITVDEGQEVAAGQVLARLDLAEIDARAARARTALDKAARDLERARLLFEDRVAPLEQLQDAESAHSLARSDLEVAEFNRRHGVIRAPARGKILKRFAAPGEQAAPGQPVLVFASSEKSWVLRFGAIDRDVVRLRLGDPAEVRFDVFPERLFAAVVSEIAEAADPASGTFEVELTLDAGEDELVSGFIARTEVMPSRRVSLTFIPLQALVEGEGKKAWVYTVDSETSRARKLPVILERISDGRAAVRSGLEQVEAVVTGGASYLNEGVRVKVLAEED